MRALFLHWQSPCLFVLFTGISVSAQDTFSIVAVDLATGQVGSAGATCLDDNQIAGGAVIISDVIPDVGAIHTQSYWVPANQDAAHEQVVDNCMDWKGHIVGPNYAIQGNILLGEEILTQMEAGFVGTEGSLAEKLMAAMQGANVAGADTRCLDEGVSSRSAFLRVAYPGDNAEDLTLDLVVAITPEGVEPIDVLQAEFDAWWSGTGVPEDGAEPAPLLITRKADGEALLKWSGPTPAEMVVFDARGARLESVPLTGPWTVWRPSSDGTLFLRLIDANGDLLSTMQYSGTSPAPNTQRSDRE